MKTSEVLNRAARVIERDGWWQSGRGTTGGGSVGSATCAANAIFREADSLLQTKTAQRHLAAHLGYVGDDYLTFIWRWNDDAIRTSDEVIDSLRAAADERTEAHA